MLKRFITGLLAVVLVVNSTNLMESAYGQTGFGMSDAVTEENISAQGSNSFGNLLADSINEKMDEQEQNLGCNIFAAEISGTEVTVDFESTYDAVLVAAIYEESGIKLIASGKTEVHAGEMQACVSIDIEEMPQYFYLRCFLVDGETLIPFCSAYESPNYTQEMQEFLTKTTEDFEPEQVVNLDGDTANNFAVCGGDTIVIPQAEGENIVAETDEENNRYILEQIDENISSLQPGNIFVYEYGENETLILKIATIQIDGDTAVITGADTSMEEVFSYVKIDSKSSSSNAVVDDSGMAEGVSFEGLVKYEEDEIQPYAWENEGKESFALSYQFANAKLGGMKLSGSLDLKLEASLKFYISWEYQYLELKIDYSGKLSAAVSGKASGKIPVGFIGISPIPGVFIEFTPSLVAEASAKIEFGGKLTGTIGFSVSNDEGIKNLTSSPSLKGEIKGEVKLFLGLSLEPKIKILSDAIAYASLEAMAGGELTAKMDIYKTPSSSKVHGCSQCVAGDISAKWELKFEVKILNLEQLKFTLKAEDSWKLLDFYYSFDHDSFDFTTCPYYKYRTKITVTDEKGKKLENVKIAAPFHVSKNEENETVTSFEDLEDAKYITTDADGKAVGYLSAGYYTLKISADGYKTIGQRVFVLDEPKDIAVRLSKGSVSSSGGGGSINVIAPYNPNAVKEVFYGSGTMGTIMEDDSLYMWGNNEYGQLGNGTTISSQLPIKILENVRLASTAYHVTEAITKDNSWYIWGDDYWYGSTAFGSTPVKILDNVENFCIDEYTSGAVTKDGSLYMFGYNHHGQLGIGTSPKSGRPERVLEDISFFNMVDSGAGAIAKDGSLYMWGKNTCGRLGIGTDEDSYLPVKIMKNIKSVSIGNDITAAITKDGSLYMWGNNTSGRLGIGTTEDSYAPVKVMENVDSVFINRSFTGAITKDGSLYMWGSNYNGCLGIGTEENSYVPVKVLNDVDFVCFEEDFGGNVGAITKDGTLYEWGNNKSSQTGTNTGTYYVCTPIKVLEHVEYFDFSSSGTAGAITEDGSLYAWGQNLYGLNGYAGILAGDFNYGSGPLKILSNVRWFGRGSGTFAIALTNNGTLYMWGRNSMGYLDTEYYYWSAIPKKIEFPEISTYADSGLSDTDKVTATFQNLTPNDTYNFYAVKSLNEEDILSSENLLAISQTTADENGNMTVSYELKEPCETASIFVVGASKRNLSEAEIEIADLHYDGSGQMAVPTVTCQGNTLVWGRDYQLEGGFLATDIGTYTLIISGTGTYTGTATAEYHVICSHSYTETVTKQPDCTHDGEKTLLCNICGDSYTETIPKTGHTRPDTWVTEKVATCTSEGRKSIKCTVCKETIETAVVYAVSTVTLASTDYIYNGNVRTPSVIVADSKGNRLKEKFDYMLTYAGDRKNVGKYTVTVTLKGSYRGTVNKTFTIQPKTTSIVKAEVISKGITVRWKKQAKQANGYEIAYSTSKKFAKKSTRTKTIKKAGAVAATITKLKAKKKYYIKIRAYKTVKANGQTTKIYGNWSKAKIVKMK